MTGQWHHRRSRSVRADHRHCPCNGVWLCPTCHGWVHKHPFEARGEGLIVSRSVAEPGNVLATAYYGQVYLQCSGSVDEADSREEETYDATTVDLEGRRAGDD